MVGAGAGLGKHPKMWDPYLFLQPLKLATSYLVHNLGLGVRYNNNFSTELGSGWLGYRSTSFLWTSYHVYPVPRRPNSYINVIKLQIVNVKKPAV